MAELTSTAEVTDILSQVSVSGVSETEWPAAKIRSTFIKFFTEKKGHTFWPSSPVVPINDPTLLFANAGMNQYKPLFLGTCDPSLEMATLKMAVNSQKCIRAGGKHNDLEDVGKDVYHHTFFEMLGNWSFGAYFKEEAIAWAWECLSEEFKLDTSRLYATYFEGDAAQGLSPDLEAKQIWMKYLPEDRIIACGAKDNFWEMGATGPCGPCVEIHYDRIGGRNAAQFVNADLPDVIEIWNNVFIQFNREADGSLKELPSKHVDTGMGFERLASILQGKTSNYDTDIFTPIFQQIQEITGCRPYQGKLGAADEGLVDMAYRVVADHIRTLTFAITDGATPSNEGRGYVLRRILRRAVRYGQELLGAPGGFFTRLVPVVVRNFSDMFPELEARQSFVMTIIQEEEESFNRTLDQGVKHFTKVAAGLSASGSTVVPAKDAHILFSSMGFPLDLTELMAQERGLTVDTAGFEQLMEMDRKISEAAQLSRKGGGSKDLSMEAEQTAWLASNNVSTTDSSLKYTWHCSPEATVVAVFQGRGGDTAGFSEEGTAADGSIGVLLDLTSFYYESGGQIFDTGVLEGPEGRFLVTNAQTYAGYVVHVGAVESGSLKVGSKVRVKVDYERRGFVAPNHTMTHVLNYALRTVLLGKDAAGGEGVSLCDQKGSLVDAEKLRFDFSWTKALTVAQVEEVEKIVNQQIQASLPVYAEVVPLAEASAIHALRKVFGERYPDPVRVLSVGQPVETLLKQPTLPQWSDFSIEFCGGTHLTNTSQAELCLLVEESGIAKGIRRLVGLTRAAAKAAKKEAEGLIERLELLAKVEGGPELLNSYKAIKMEVDQAMVSIVDKDRMRAMLKGIYETLRQYFKANAAQKISAANEQIEVMAAQAVASNQGVVVVHLEIGADGKVAKKIQDKFKGLHPSGSFFLATFDEEVEKVGIYAMVSPDHVSQGATAKAWVDACVQAVGAGKGGGRPDLANGSIPLAAVGPKDAPEVIMQRVLAAAEGYAKSSIQP